MTFQSLQRVLSTLDQQSSWRSHRQIQQVLTVWPELVGPAVAAQTRPWALQAGVLQVGVSSAPWVQTLMFERLRILEKLNARLPYPITDIRFSTTWWHRRSLCSSAELQTESARVWWEHPSRLHQPAGDRPHQSGVAQPTDPQSAFRAWASQMRSRTAQMPLCPRCHCPTPQGELERWSCCGLCAAKQW